jgi:hypothetical protein
MPYVAPSTLATGTLVTSTHWAIHVNNQKFLHGPPTVQLTRAAAQNIPDTAWTGVSWDTEVWDTNTMWSSTAPTKVYARTAGKFLVTQIGSFAATTGGAFRALGIRVNTTSGDPRDAHISNETQSQAWVKCLTSMVSLTTGQFIEAVQIQNSGAGLNTDTTFDPRLSMIWMSS